MAKRAWSKPTVTLLGSADEIWDFVGSTKLSDADAQKVSKIMDAVASTEPSTARRSAR